MPSCLGYELAEAMRDWSSQSMATVIPWIAPAVNTCARFAEGWPEMCGTPTTGYSVKMTATNRNDDSQKTHD